MKRSLVIAALAVLSLGGCVAVPVYDGGSGYGYGYDTYYAPPAASISFGYFHGGGHRHGQRHRHRGHRH